MSSFVAQYPGECTDCGSKIDPGDRIIADDEFSGYRHAICPDDRDDSAGAACSSCNLVHAGECF